MKNILIITIVLILALVFTVVGSIFSILSSPNQSVLLVEIAKGMLTLALVAIAGGGIKWLYDETTNEKRKEEKKDAEEIARMAARKERQKQYYDSLVEMSLEVSGQFSINDALSGTERQRYLDRMHTLTNLRPKLIRLLYQLEIAPTLFAEQNEIEKRINDALSFVDSLLGEFSVAEQGGKYEPLDSPADLPAADFPEYAKFEKKKLGAKVSEIMKQILSVMTYDILELR